MHKKQYNGWQSLDKINACMYNYQEYKDIRKTLEEE